jgi:hypothetical protein
MLSNGLSNHWYNDKICLLLGFIPDTTRTADTLVAAQPQ